MKCQHHIFLHVCIFVNFLLCYWGDMLQRTFPLTVSFLPFRSSITHTFSRVQHCVPLGREATLCQPLLIYGRLASQTVNCSFSFFFFLLTKWVRSKKRQSIDFDYIGPRDKRKNIIIPKDRGSTCMVHRQPKKIRWAGQSMMDHDKISKVKCTSRKKKDE